MKQVDYAPDGKLYAVRFQYLTSVLRNEVRKQYHRAEAKAKVITEQEDKIEAQEQQIESLQTGAAERGATAACDTFRIAGENAGDNQSTITIADSVTNVGRFAVGRCDG